MAKLSHVRSITVQPKRRKSEVFDLRTRKAKKKDQGHQFFWFALNVESTSSKHQSNWLAFQ